MEPSDRTQALADRWLEHHAARGLLDVDDPAAEPLVRRYRMLRGRRVRRRDRLAAV
jgi:hypothetical protein